MAQPQAYNRETDFTERDGDDTNHPGINTELDAAAQSINEIRDNLALIQRDDGALQNGIVTAESLAPTAFDAFKGDLNEAVADAQTAATSANNAAVSANTARDTAVAAKDTAVTSANAAALNATTATTKAAESSASATASQTSATASANSATASQTSRLAAEAARDVAQAAQAATSASQTAAAASAAAAGTSATSATNSATTATTQAGIATTQAASASASATAAAASLEDFGDRYLGSKTADPTTDNDGNALITGALYFNSVAGEMRVWAGTFWKATGSSVGGTINTAKYTATAGQTTFAIVYDVGFVHVYLNGVKLESGVEFTANNGTSVVLATGATAGDVVDMIAFGIFSVANTYTKAEADALLGAKAPQATTYTKSEVDTADALKLNAANPSYTGTLTGGTGVVNFGAGQFYKDASGNVGLGATPTTPSLTLDSTKNISFKWPNGQNYANIFNQENSAATVMSSGYQRSASANGFASSVSVSWPRAAAVVGNGAVTLYADPESTVAIGTDIVPTARMIVDAQGRVRMPYQTAFMACGSGTQSWSGAQAYQTVSFASVFSIGSRVTSFSSSAFTAPVSGAYLFLAKITPTTGTGGPQANLFINGVAYSGPELTIAYGAAYAASTGFAIVQLNTNDSVTLRVSNNNSTSFSLDLGRCSFSGFLIG